MADRPFEGYARAQEESKMACPRCVWGRGGHAEWCGGEFIRISMHPQGCSLMYLVSYWQDRGYTYDHEEDDVIVMVGKPDDAC